MRKMAEAGNPGGSVPEDERNAVLTFSNHCEPVNQSGRHYVIKRSSLYAGG
jgi:hypothetical protein